MPITINSKVYNWAQFDPNSVSRYQETAAGIPTGYSPLTNRVNTGTGKSSNVKWRLAVPVIATVETANWAVGDVIDTDYLSIEFQLSNKGILTQRQDLRLRGAGLWTNAQFIASVDNLVQATG
jgi:hypothetical protein